MKKRIIMTAALLLLIGAFVIITACANGGDADYPSITSITPDTNGFTLKWTAYPDAAAYRLFVRGTSGWNRVGDTKGLTLRHANLTDQTTYTYTVRALDSSGKYMSSYLVKGWSAAFRAAPAMTSAAPSGSALKVTWNPVEGAGCYRIYRRQGSGWVGIDFTDDTTYFDTNVQPGQSVTYTVRAFADDRKTILSAYQAGGITATYVTMPTVYNVEARNAGVRISWNKTPGAAQYRVFIKNGTGWKRIGDTVNAYFDYAIRPNSVPITYTVRAMDANGRYSSEYSREGMTHTYLPTPVMNSVTNLLTGQKITWTKVPGAAHYRVYIRSGSSWVKLADTDADSLTTTTVRNNISYTYTVRCLSEDGKAFVSGFSRSGMTMRFFDTPEINAVENNRSGAVIKWNAIPGIAKYRVFMKNGASWKGLGNSSGTRFTHTGIEQGTTYTYTIRGLDSAGNYCSSFVTPGFVNHYQIAPLLRNVMPSADGGTVLDWSEYVDAHRYRVYRRYLDTNGWIRVADVDGLTYTDTAAPAGIPCQYTLRALDADGNIKSDFYDNKQFYVNGVLASGEVNVKGYLVTFDRGRVTKGYVTAQDIIKIARAEVGTKATNYKRCKYNNWYYGYDVSGDWADWCVVFVEWVFNRAGARDLLYEKTAGAEYFGQGFYNHGRLIKSGFKVGDLLLLHWREGESSYVPGFKLLNHVGIIISVNDDGSYTTIEGNTGDSPNGEVMIKTRYPDLISGACRPNYGFSIPAK